MLPERILVPVDTIPPARKDAAELAVRLASEWARTLRAEVVLMSAIPAVGGVRGETLNVLLKVRKDQCHAAEEELERLAGFLKNDGVSARTEVVTGADHIASTISDYAEDHQVDLILLPSRSRPPRGAFHVGSVALSLLRHANRPVLLVPAAETLGWTTAEVRVGEGEKGWLSGLLSRGDGDLQPA